MAYDEIYKAANAIRKALLLQMEKLKETPNAKDELEINRDAFQAVGVLEHHATKSRP